MADDIRIVVLADDQASGPLNQIATGALRSVGAAVVSMAGDAVQALASFGASSIQVAGDFEAGMNTFQAAAGDSLAAAGLSVDDFREKFIQIGAELPVSTAAVQEAATTLIKGGLDPLVVKMGGLESSIKFAAAAGMDLNQAAELSIKQLGTFVPITASAAEQTAFLASSQDMLVKAAGASTLDVDKLGDAMLGAGGAAKATGVGYQDFVTTMGLISPGFQSAATAGTSYKNFLTRLIPQTSDATGWMQKLGLYTSETGSKFFDATGAFVGNREAANLLSHAFTGLSDAERSEAAAMIFGNDAKDAAIALAANGAAGYDKFADAMSKASGVQATAQTVQQGFNIALDNFHGSIEALQIVVGTALLPALTMLFNGVLSPAINTVTTLAQALLGSQDAFARLSPILQSVVVFFGDLWTAGTAIGVAFTSAGTYSAAFGAALDQLGAALGLPAGLLSAVSFAIQDFIAAIAPAVAAIAAFVMGTGDLGTVADFLIELFGVTIGGLLADAIGVLNNYATVWIDLGTTIYNVVAALMSGDLAGAWAALTSGITQVITDYQVYAASLGQLILSLGQTIVGAVVTYAPIIATQVLAWGTAFISWISPYIPIALGYLASFAASVWGWVVAQAPVLLGMVAGWGQALVDWIGPAIPPALAALGGLASSVFGWVGQQAAPLVASFVAWATALVEWIPGATVDFLAAWPGMLNSFLDWIGNAAGPLLAKLGEWGLQFVAWVAPQIPGILVAVAGIAAAILVWIGETVLVLAGKLIEWGGAFLGWVKTEVVPKLPGILEDIKTAISGWITTAVGWVADQAKTIGSNIIDGIKKGISDGVGALTSAVKSAANDALNAAKKALGIASPSKAFAEVGSFSAQGIGVGFMAMMPKVTTNLVNGVSGLMDKIASAVDKGSQALNAVSSFKGSSGTGLAGFLAGIKDLANQFNDAAVSLGGRILGTATRFADTIGKVTAPIDTALKALGGLVDFVPPVRANISAFIASLYILLNALNNMAQMFEAKSVKVAAAFAEGAGKLVALVGPSIDALKKLPDLVVPAQSQVNAFGDALARLVAELLNVADLFAQRSLSAAGVFGDAATKVIGLVGPAIDALKKLPDLVSPSNEALAAFGDALARTVQMLVQVASYFEADAVAAAATFAEGAGKAVSIIGGAVDGFTKLASFQGVPASTIAAFQDALNGALTAIEYLSANWIAECVDRAATFAEGAGKAVSIIGGAVDGFTKLASFEGVPAAAFSAFQAALNDALTVIDAVAASWIADFVTRAATFAEGAGKAVSIIGGAVDGFTKLASFEGVPAAAFSTFAQALNQSLTLLDALAAQWSGDALTIASTFATNVAKVVGDIKTALDTFSTLGQVNGDGGVLKAFMSAASDLIATMNAYLPPNAEVIGSNTIAGLINGIVGQRANLITAMVNTVLAAVQAAQQTLGIASPSTVFAQMGVQSAAGYVGGAETMQPAVAAAGQGLAQAASQGAADLMPDTRSSAPSPASSTRTLTLNVAPGAIVIHAAAGQSEQAIADAGLARLQQLARQAAVS